MLLPRGQKRKAEQDVSSPGCPALIPRRRGRAVPAPLLAAYAYLQNFDVVGSDFNYPGRPIECELVRVNKTEIENGLYE